MEALFYFGFKLMEFSIVASAKIVVFLFRIVRAHFTKSKKSFDTTTILDEKTLSTGVKLDPSDAQHVTGGLDRH